MQWMIEGKWLFCGGALFALGSCVTAGGGLEARAISRQSASPVSAPMLSDTPVKLGKPYKVGGITYAPADDPLYDDVGYASWYGEELAGNRTANGEVFDPDGVSAAHRTLPLPSYVEVTALKTGRTILVRVNDRGPFSNDRLIDLSRGAAEQLGVSGRGSTAVRVRRVNPPEQERVHLRSGLRAAERIEAPEPLLAALRARLEEAGTAAPGDTGSPPRLPYEGLPPDASPAKTDGDLSFRPPLPAIPALPEGKSYMVQLAAFASESRARAAAHRTDAILSPSAGIWRLRTGPYADAAGALKGVKLAAASGFNGALVVVND